MAENDKERDDQRENLQNSRFIEQKSRDRQGERRKNRSQGNVTRGEECRAPNRGADRYDDRHQHEKSTRGGGNTFTTPKLHKDGERMPDNSGEDSHHTHRKPGPSFETRVENRPRFIKRRRD